MSKEFEARIAKMREEHEREMAEMRKQYEARVAKMYADAEARSKAIDEKYAATCKAQSESLKNWAEQITKDANARCEADCAAIRANAEMQRRQIEEDIRMMHEQLHQSSAQRAFEEHNLIQSQALFNFNMMGL